MGGLFSKIKDAANKVGSAFKGGEREAQEVFGAIEKKINDIKDEAVEGLQKERDRMGHTLKDYKDHSIKHLEREARAKIGKFGRDVKDISNKAGKEIEAAGKKGLKETEKFFKGLAKSGAPEVLADCGTPKSISISGQVVGNGVSITYSDNEEVIKEVLNLIRGGDFNVDIMYHLVPSRITIEVGVELALVVSVDVGASITYDSRDDIQLVVEWFKKNT